MHFGKEIDIGDYICIELEPDDDFDWAIPECCQTCGGDYPNCVDSCSIFDQ